MSFFSPITRLAPQPLLTALSGKTLTLLIVREEKFVPVPLNCSSRDLNVLSLLFPPVFLLSLGTAAERSQMLLLAVCHSSWIVVSVTIKLLDLACVHVAALVHGESWSKTLLVIGFIDEKNE